MGMKIAICDDEYIVSEQIRQLIRKQEQTSQERSKQKQPGQEQPSQITVYENGETLLAEGKTFDLIFLDIRMDGISGIETAREIRKRQEDTVLIFITGIKEYVFEAFDVKAFHYLLKPVKEEKFAQVFELAAAEVEKKRKNTQKQLFIKTRNRNITVNVKDILYIENQKRKAEIHTQSEVIVMYAAMKELEQQLGESFYRCHRGYLVNMAYITEYHTDSICLSNGETVYLSREKYHGFVKAYMHYLRNGGTICV